MSGALWAEIQERYGFTAPDPFDPAEVSSPRGGFWVARTCEDPQSPVGSIALIPREGTTAELDVMHVADNCRRQGLAHALLDVVEEHARQTGTVEIVLRAGTPQPEALAFYQFAGYERIEPFGRWVSDETAVCFRKRLV